MSIELETVGIIWKQPLSFCKILPNDEDIPELQPHKPGAMSDYGTSLDFKETHTSGEIALIVNIIECAMRDYFGRAGEEKALEAENWLYDIDCYEEFSFNWCCDEAGYDAITLLHKLEALEGKIVPYKPDRKRRGPY